MSIALQDLPVEERIKMVEDLWDSIAADKHVLALSGAQKIELDRRLNAYEIDGNRGRLASAAVADIRRKL